MIAADRNVSQPELDPVGHNQIGGVGAHRHDNNRLRRIFWVDIIRVGDFIENVVDDDIENRQGRKLDDINVDIGLFEWLQSTVDRFPLHRKQSDFRILSPAVYDRPTQLLPVPDDFFDRKRNLLFDFVFDNVRQGTSIDRWRLEKAAQSRLPWNTDRNRVAAHFIA